MVHDVDSCLHIVLTTYWISGKVRADYFAGLVYCKDLRCGLDHLQVM